MRSLTVALSELGTIQEAVAGGGGPHCRIQQQVTAAQTLTAFKPDFKPLSRLSLH
jgi:hypothetical protein